MPASERFENYEVLRREDGSLFELGRGGMGVTYKARDTDLHCDVALKVINPSILGNPDACERFLREARAAARLRHPNIASVFRLGKAADETHFYAMEFCEGPTLHQAVAARGPLPAAEAVRIAWQVCKALLVAEQHRVVHRDLKPANLILTESRDEGTVVKVIDFGLAKSFAPGKQTLATMGTNGFVGTAHFASPEQLEEHELDIRSDIYSLGVCLWFMLDGQPPFTGSLARVMSQMLSSDPPWDRLAAQPARVVQFLRWMLAKSPKDRPATAAELRRELEECIRALEESPVPGRASPRAPVAANGALEEWKFATRYPMSEEVGRDVLGRIFRGVDTSKGGATVAVRVIDAALLAAPAVRRDLEAQIAAARAHPHRHVVTLFEYALSAHGLCLATEWLEGFSLLELLKRRGALAPDEVVRLLAPLAEAADHAARYGLCGLQISKQQVHVHFPGGLQREERERVLVARVEQWPPHVVKADVLSLSENDGARSGTMHSMMTLVPGSRTNGAGARASIPALASLANELLGARGGAFSVPIARLSEAGNAVLRRASREEHAFPTAATFVEALAGAIGKDASASPRTPKPPLSSSPSSHLRLRAPVGMALLLLAFVGACFGYYYGIHQPREHARQRRETESRKVSQAPGESASAASAEQERVKAEAERAKQLAEQQRLSQNENERLKIDAEKAKVEAAKVQAEMEIARLAASRSATPMPFASVASGMRESFMTKVFASVATPSPLTPAQAPPNALLVRDDLSPGGNMRVKNWRYDNGTFLAWRIVLESTDAPTWWRTLYEDNHGASILVSPDDQWLVLNNSHGSSGGGAQIYRQSSWHPPSFGVPAGFDGEGKKLEDRTWRFYLAMTGRKPDSDRDHVVISGKTWSPDSRIVTIRITSMGSNRDWSVPSAWECTFDVNTEQFRALSPSNNPAAPSGTPVVALPGERFPETRLRLLTPQDLQGWSEEKLRYAINEMYARHGADFNNKAITKIFVKYPWYHPPKGKSYDTAESEFSSLEEQNVKLLGAQRDQRAGRVTPSPIVPQGLVPPAAPATPDPNIAHGPRYRGGGHVYRVPELKTLVGQRLSNAWLYGDFLFKGNNGNIGFFITTAIVLLPKEGSTQLQVEFPDGVQLSQNAINVLHDPMLVIPVRFNASDPIELLGVSQQNDGHLLVRARARGALRF